jgi:L-ribulose-5-phosphate 3-epimerase UlaE
MQNPIGVMQGRLLPKYMGRYQAHPVGYWQEEFKIAAELDLNCIEFILDYDQAINNPLLTNEGISKIRKTVLDTGIEVKSVCADYFMEAPLHSSDAQQVQKSKQILKQLLESADKLGISDLVIPCVDNSSLLKDHHLSLLQNQLEQILPKAESLAVNLALEADLAPVQFKSLLNQLDSPRVTVNYDIGNSTSLGYIAAEELSAYGERISDIHVKDRICGGGSVMLGKGSADIPEFFDLLKPYNYNGPIIMQAYRDDEGLGVFKSQLKWLKSNVEGF